ncbi:MULTISPECIES: VC0807 family protein [Burkholderia]|uniref:VC0807 family protein n=1 Tax=Burkholderia TaxID=32008 RepID=UPI00075CA4AF|nr:MULTISPECIES: VC0807 family protein [Burkholderia]AOJ71373.1 hypothetical protein WS78_21265 [Burkholderia savannae]AOJ84001.1 hypothetical protein WS86_25745 [Burkholderia savannae]KVG49187.1 hypothetical protein WS77_26355 [Burkholderia sp. MSMB0265]KVG81893.1 hypothetical protein WS81_10990 [Burkholderia sp. MSMB2040]KVG92408.1 hypothetical protein WS82_11455 [Burkholderia sp. MSMB2041]
MKIRPGLVAELTVNLLLPWAAYRAAVPHWGETGGLIASAVPPLVWSAIELARFRRIDALSAVVLFGIVLSIAAALAGGSPRMLLMRESLASGAIGVAFLGSLALPKPLVFHLARATVAREAHDGAARIDALWVERPAFVSAMRLMTLVWGAGLVAENLLRAWMIWNWPVERVLVVAPFVGYAIYGALMMWTLWYRKVMRTHALAGLPRGGALG